MGGFNPFQDPLQNVQQRTAEWTAAHPGAAPALDAANRVIADPYATAVGKPPPLPAAPDMADTYLRAVGSNQVLRLRKQRGNADALGGQSILTQFDPTKLGG